MWVEPRDPAARMRTGAGCKRSITASSISSLSKSEDITQGLTYLPTSHPPGERHAFPTADPIRPIQCNTGENLESIFTHSDNEVPHPNSTCPARPSRVYSNSPAQEVKECPSTSIKYISHPGALVFCHLSSQAAPNRQLTQSKLNPWPMLNPAARQRQRNQLGP